MWLTIRRSFSWAAKQKFLRSKRWLIFLLASPFFYYIPFAADSRAYSLEIWEKFLYLCSAWIAIVVPYLALPLLAEEKKQGVLELLLLSKISSSELVFGNLLSSWGVMLGDLLLLVPWFVLAIHFGELYFSEVTLGYALLASYLLLVLSLKIVAISLFRPPQHQGITLLFVLLWLAITAGLSAWVNYLALSPSLESWLTIFFPLVILKNVAQFSVLAIGGHILVNLVLAGILCGIANFLLCQQEVATTTQSNTQSKPKSFPLSPLSPLSTRKQGVFSPISGNPIAWKDYHKVYRGPRFAVIKFFAMLIPGIVIQGITWWLAKNSTQALSLKFFLSFSLVVSCAILVLLLFSYSVHALVREKKQSQWELILLSTLSGKDIWQGKIIAILKGVLPCIVLALLMMIGLELLSSKSLFHVKTLLRGSFFVSNVLCFCSFAFLLSCYLQRPGAVALGSFVWIMVWSTIEKIGVHRYYFSLTRSRDLFFCICANLLMTWIFLLLSKRRIAEEKEDS